MLGRDEAVAFLAGKPVGFIWGVGKASAGAAAARRLPHRSRTCSAPSETDLMRRYGVEGRRLWRLARGIDDRSVNPERETKSVSAETTFNQDIADYKALEKLLWSLSEKVSARLKASGIAGATITLKLKTADFRLRTRARSLGEPTQLAARIFEAGRDLLRARDRRHEIPPDRHRRLEPHRGREGRRADLVDQKATRAAKAEHAIDKVREKFGKAAMVKGLVFDGAARERMTMTTRRKKAPRRVRDSYAACCNRLVAKPADRRHAEALLADLNDGALLLVELELRPGNVGLRDRGKRRSTPRRIPPGLAGPARRRSDHHALNSPDYDEPADTAGRVRRKIDPIVI